MTDAAHIFRWDVEFLQSIVATNKMKSELEKFRTRWRRWLGNKTRVNEPHWVTLLKSNWIGWVYGICNIAPISPFMQTRETVKAIYAEAINKAEMKDLRKLDSLYTFDKFERRRK